MNAAERTARLDRVSCVHGAGFGSCSDPYCCSERARVLVAAAIAVTTPGPDTIPTGVALSATPHCRWCHLPIRGALSDRGWAHVETRREACADGLRFAAPITENDQRRVFGRAS